MATSDIFFGSLMLHQHYNDILLCPQILTEGWSFTCFWEASMERPWILCEDAGFVGVLNQVSVWTHIYEIKDKNS